jgi:3-hydroxymyristoyl/3-hydroxydecanoyl-(acyl carrier protein) dehydratase
MDLRGKVISAKATLLSSVVSAGIIIQKFGFELSSNGIRFFEGETTFGFFTGETMAKQAGLDGGGKSTHPQKNGSQAIMLDTKPVLNMVDPSNKRAYYTLPRGQMRFLDEIWLLPDAANGKPVSIYGSKMINPQDWFFNCHFYQDPVMPGSLGVEAVFEAIKAYALHDRLGYHFINPHFGLEAGQDITWKYRGQIIPANKHMEIEVVSLVVEEHPDRIVVRGDASLWVDQVRIYEIKNAAINVREGGKND